MTELTSAPSGAPVGTDDILALRKAGDGGLKKVTVAEIGSALGATDIRAFTVEFSLSGTTPVISNQKNVASVTRTSTGRYRITFTTELSNNFYTLATSARYNTSESDEFPSVGVDRRSGRGQTTTHIDIDVIAQVGGSLSDNLDFVKVVGIYG